MERSDLGSELIWIVESLGAQLPAADRDNVLEFVRYGEWKLAAETLCDQLGEAQAAPTEEVYEKIMSVASSLQVGERYLHAVPAPTRV